MANKSIIRGILLTSVLALTVLAGSPMAEAGPSESCTQVSADPVEVAVDPEECRSIVEKAASQVVPVPPA